MTTRLRKMSEMTICPDKLSVCRSFLPDTYTLNECIHSSSKFKYAFSTGGQELYFCLLIFNN